MPINSPIGPPVASPIGTPLAKPIFGIGAFRAIAGWIGTQSCALTSDTIHTVQFSAPVTFINHTGVKFINSTTAETAATPPGIITTSPAQTIEYTVTWVTPPVSGDVIVFEYTEASGNYEDADAVAMENQLITLVNCHDIITANSWDLADGTSWDLFDGSSWDLA